MEKTMEGLGFGFDARSNAYKIVRILQDDNRKGLETRVQIYTLSTDSWRSLECEVPALCNPIPAVFLNGNLHWFVSKHTEGYGSVLLFNVASEVFDEMVPSEEFLHVLSVSSEAVLSVLNDLLAVCTIRGEAVGHPKPLSVCSIWVMREYGVPESWTELYSFEYSGRVSGVDGFTRDGELLMLTADKGQVSWNPITGQFAILSLPRCCDWVTVVESLVSL
ncbi:F-box/kelch-repeat protein At3g06240-like isoform X2 [Eucalyptus grandis]|uniref:F-box/kelch-repeat protein At3g06240-like isoform X2 n=1 Tax=Eucalyptus grandis TaxID=71139 RepID=UPI00192EC554|nr:F-box/kelch-repeat protein At3g06240-like isoform X2 [Eucalyptus grandis]